MSASATTATRTETPAVAAWVRLLRGHAGLVRSLNTDLMHGHGLTINDYEALLLLAHAPDGRLRRTDLAQDLILTASGVTRLLDGLEQAGLVEKATCATDGRVVYAVLTARGRERLEQASVSHLAAIEELFAERFTSAEVEQLAELLGRLAGGDTPSCAPPS